MDRVLLRLRQRVTTGAVEPDSKARRVYRTGVGLMGAAVAATLVVVLLRLPAVEQRAVEGAVERVGPPDRNASADPSLKVQVRIKATAIAWCARWPSIPLAQLMLKMRKAQV